MKKTILLLYTFMLMVGSTQAQPKHAEPYLMEIVANARKKNVSDIERFKALTAFVNLWHSFSPPDTTIKLINELLILNIKIHASDPKPYLLMIEGQRYLKYNKPDSALMKFREMIEEFDKSRHIFLSNSYLFSIRTLFDRLGRKEDRLKYYNSKLQGYLQHGPKENTATCYNTIGGYYALRSDHNQSLTYYFKALDVYRTFSTVGYESMMMTLIGNEYLNWGNLERATRFLQMADSLGKRDHDSIRCQSCWAKLAIISDRQGRYQEALNRVDSGLMYGFRGYWIESVAVLYSTAVSVNLKLHKTDEAYRYLVILKKLVDGVNMAVETAQGSVEIDYLFYQYYLQKNDPRRAEQSLLRAYQKSDSIRSWTLSLKYQKELFLFYKNTPTPSKALSYATAFFQLSDSLSLNKNKNAVAQYETELAEKQREAEIQNLKIKRSQQQWNYLTGGVFMLLIII
ncbi:MAG: hypothetical protein WCI71_18160, partial [Bacteroidota bacterium]